MIVEQLERAQLEEVAAREHLGERVQRPPPLPQLLSPTHLPTRQLMYPQTHLPMRLLTHLLRHPLRHPLWARL